MFQSGSHCQHIPAMKRVEIPTNYPIMNALEDLYDIDGSAIVYIFCGHPKLQGE
jgi:hypothetical protein